MYWLSYELKLIYLKHTFINTNSELKKSVRICYVVKKVFLDWTSYAITVGVSGSQTVYFSTYLVQSKILFERFS